MNMDARIDFPKVWRRNQITAEQIEGIGRQVPTAKSLREIARNLGLSLQTVQRRAAPIIEAMREAGTLGHCKCGLPRFHPRICSRNAIFGAGRTWQEQIEWRRKVVAQIMTGDTFGKIAEQWGISAPSVRKYQRWLTPAQLERRKAMERARYRHPVYAIVVRPHSDPLYALISTAVPRWLSEATRDDAISDLYLAVMEGSVAVEDIATEARRYATKAVTQWENRFGPRSLDELAFEDGRDTLGDMIADPATIEPLEWRLST